MKLPPEVIVQIFGPLFFVGYIYGGMYFFGYLTDFVIYTGRVLLGY